MAQNVSFLGELFKQTGEGLQKQVDKGSSQDLLELMLKHQQIERLKKEDEIQAEAMRSSIAKRFLEAQDLERQNQPITPEQKFNFKTLTGKDLSPSTTQRDLKDILGPFGSMARQESRQNFELTKPRRMTVDERQSVTSMDKADGLLSKIELGYSKYKNKLGPLNPQNRSIEILRLTNTDPGFRQFIASTKKLWDQYRLEITKTQASFAELQNLETRMPDPKDKPADFLGMLEGYKSDHNRAKGTLREILESERIILPKFVDNWGQNTITNPLDLGSKSKNDKDPLGLGF